MARSDHAQKIRAASERLREAEHVNKVVGGRAATRELEAARQAVRAAHRG